MGLNSLWLATCFTSVAAGNALILANGASFLHLCPRRHVTPYHLLLLCEAHVAPGRWPLKLFLEFIWRRSKVDLPLRTGANCNRAFASDVRKSLLKAFRGHYGAISSCNWLPFDHKAYAPPQATAIGLGTDTARSLPYGYGRPGQFGMFATTAGKVRVARPPCKSRAGSACASSATSFKERPTSQRGFLCVTNHGKSSTSSWGGW